MEWIRAGFTIMCFVMFVLLAYFAYARKNKTRQERIARSVIEDNDTPDEGEATRK